MLPMATPPNGIVFGSGKIAVWDMIKAGFWLNLASLIIILLFSQPLVHWFPQK
jgi:sodium-dependent dicarboxylate transporter 2/3/5